MHKEACNVRPLCLASGLAWWPLAVLQRKNSPVAKKAFSKPENNFGKLFSLFRNGAMFLPYEFTFITMLGCHCCRSLVIDAPGS